MIRTFAASLLASLVVLAGTGPLAGDVRVPVATAEAANVPGVVSQEPRRMRAKTVRLRGRLGYARAFSAPQPLSPRALRRLEKQFRGVNPPAPPLPGPPAPPPAKPPSPDPPSAAAAARVPIARAAAANDYVLFRSRRVAMGAGVTSATGEPSVANDRNSLLFTGNFHAAVSPDNGLSWQALDPSDSQYYPQYDGGFCCDQVAYAVDRGPNSLVLWLRQFSNDGALNPADGANGRVSLIVYQGRAELLDAPEVVSQADYCEYNFKPSDFGFVTNSWFDFNQVSHTEKYLYISSKAQQNNGDTNGDGQFDSAFLDGVVWRMELDDLDDDNCGSLPVSYFAGVGTGFNSSLVQGAGDGDVMHWAFQDSSTDEITITRVEDNAAAGDVFTRTMTSYLNTERPSATSSANAATCALPDATDPCLRANDKINVGYTNGEEVGWFWNVRQGNGFPFPHIRGVRFDADSSPTLIDEPDIWNPDFAWIYPTVGVNDRGHVGVSAYQMGGGRFPKPAVALVDDVAPDTDWDSLSFHGIISSDSGVSANTWGDYQSVRPYGDCANTFAGSVQSMQGGSTSANAEHRFAWFGRERDACPDLVVKSFTVGSTSIDSSEPLTVSHETQNTGSSLTPASTTRFYFSRDAGKSDDDLLRSPGSAVGQLERAATSGVVAVSITTPKLSGTWYVIACADDLGGFDEISDTNNCRAAADTVTVGPLTTDTAIPADVDFDVVAHATAGGRLPLRLKFDVAARSNAVNARIYLASRSAAGRRIRRIGSVRVPRNQRGTARRLLVRKTVRLPRTRPRVRRQFVIVCRAGRPRANRCAVSRRPLFVTRRK